MKARIMDSPQSYTIKGVKRTFSLTDRIEPASKTNDKYQGKKMKLKHFTIKYTSQF